MKRRKINPRSPLAPSALRFARRWLSGGAGVVRRSEAPLEGLKYRRRFICRPHPWKWPGPNICSHLYDTRTCLAARPLLCDPGNFSYVTTLPHLPQVAASWRSFKCGCSTMTTQTTAVWFPVRGLLLGSPSASSLNYHHLLLPFFLMAVHGNGPPTESFFCFFFRKVMRVIQDLCC